jgi:hypothetical protein
MTIPASFPRRISPAASVTAPPPDGAPAPLALVAAFAPAPVARLAALLAVVVLMTGIIGQITHTGLFFVPALAVMAVAAVRLWREGG